MEGLGFSPQNSQTRQGPTWDTGSEQGQVTLLLQAPQTDSCFSFSASLSCSHSLQKTRSVCLPPAAASALAAPAVLSSREVLPSGNFLAHPLLSPKPGSQALRATFVPAAPSQSPSPRTALGEDALCSPAAPSQDSTASLLPRGQNRPMRREEAQTVLETQQKGSSGSRIYPH